MIFISHSSKDSEINKDLLEALKAVGVGNGKIVDSSFETTGVPSNKSISEFIIKTIKKSDIQIMLITHNYLESNYCIAEYGIINALETEEVTVIPFHIGTGNEGNLLKTDKKYTIEVDAFIETLTKTLIKKGYDIENDKNKFEKFKNDVKKYENEKIKGQPYFGVTSTAIPFNYDNFKNSFTVCLQDNPNYEGTEKSIMFCGGHVSTDNPFTELPSARAISKLQEELGLVASKIQFSKEEAGPNDSNGTGGYKEDDTNTVYVFSQREYVPCYHKLDHHYHIDLVFVLKYDEKPTNKNSKNKTKPVYIEVPCFKEPERLGPCGTDYFLDKALENWNRTQKTQKQFNDSVKTMYYKAYKKFYTYAKTLGAVDTDISNECHLRIKITGECNMQCNFCHHEGGPDNKGLTDMDPDDSELFDFIHYLHQKLSFRKVSITGGEPLMHKNLVSLLKKIKEGNSFWLSITTNGTKSLDEKEWEALYFAGVRTINISINDQTNEKIKEIKDNIKTLILLKESIHNKIQKDPDDSVGQNKELKININTVINSSDDFELMQYLMDNLKLEVHLLPNLNSPISYSNSMALIRKYLENNGYNITKETIHTASSSVVRRYSNGNKNIIVKDTKANGHQPLLLEECLKCVRRDECQEGFYAIRLEKHKDSKYYVRTCLYENGSKPIPIDDYKKKENAEEIRKLRIITAD